MNTKWQKLCDSSDWFDSEFQNIIKNNLRAQPRLHRKQWEFAMIFRVLQELGMLNEQSEGIAFGAGKEVLIYSILEKVKKLTATDLYDANAYWSGTKTNNPKEYLLQRAPFEVDPNRLDAKYMNMRNITYPDNTFNFAYSSCVFEHISENDAGFIEHLLEVKRTLKEGGVYVLTTELLYNEKTLSNPGSFFFNIDHLLDIVEQSGLHLSPVFDARLTEISTNIPTPLSDDFCFKYGKTWLPHVTCLRQNLTFTSCLLALSKNSQLKPKRPNVIGYKKSQAYVKKSLKYILNNLWENWQSVNSTRGLLDKPSIIGHENFNVDLPRNTNYLAFHTPFFIFEPGTLQVKISFLSQNNENCILKLFSFNKRQGDNLKIEKVVKIICTKNQGEVIEIECRVVSNRMYAVLGRGKTVFKSINIQMRKVL